MCGFQNPSRQKNQLKMVQLDPQLN